MTTKEFVEVLRLALPVLPALTLQPLFEIVESSLIGHSTLGPAGLAGLGLSRSAFGMVFRSFNFLAYATTPMVATAAAAAANEDGTYQSKKGSQTLPAQARARVQAASVIFQAACLALTSGMAICFLLLVRCNKIL